MVVSRLQVAITQPPAHVIGDVENRDQGDLT
jgi:hypothetical protein